jgi:hypothetical protein
MHFGNRNGTYTLFTVVTTLATEEAYKQFDSQGEAIEIEGEAMG